MMKHLNMPLVRHVFGLLLLMESFFMAVATGVALYYHQTAGDSDWPALLVTTVVTLACGLLFYCTSRHYSEAISQREGFLIVAVSWVLFSVFGMLPYLIYGSIDTVSAAFLETISGFTTTGCTVLTDIDAQPHGILFWRSLTQWLGGLGIVVFSLAMLPLIGTGGTQMFSAEVTGLGVDKLRPKIHSTARRLWGIYLGLTIVCYVLFRVGDMSRFDAVNHALTTLATGGFSTHQASIGYFQSPYIEYVCGLFLFISSLNYSLFYFIGVGKWRQFWRNEELRWFFGIVVLFILSFMVLAAITRHADGTTPEQIAALGDGSWEATFRTAYFHTLSIISSAGFQGMNYDYALWGALFWIPTLLLMICGGCAGSTAGGLKVIRVIVLLKNARNEFIQQLHPRSVTSVRLNGHTLASETVYRIMALLLIYLMLVVSSIFILQCLGLSFDTAIGTTISAFGNTGPGLGSTGPAFTWAGLPAAGQWFLSFAMLTGRLEIFTVILLFTKMFWQK